MSQCDRTGRRCAADNLGCDEPECAYGSRSHVSGTAPEREARAAAGVGAEGDGRNESVAGRAGDELQELERRLGARREYNFSGPHGMYCGACGNYEGYGHLKSCLLTLARDAIAECKRLQAAPDGLLREARDFLGEVLADGWIHRHGSAPVARLRAFLAKLDAALQVAAQKEKP